MHQQQTKEKGIWLKGQQRERTPDTSHRKENHHSWIQQSKPNDPGYREKDSNRKKDAEHAKLTKRNQNKSTTNKLTRI